MIEKIEIDVAKRGHITNCYLLYNSNKEGVLIDPADDGKKIITYINKLNLKIKYIVITHAHGDHIGALEEVQNYTNADILIHFNDYDALIGKNENYSDMLGVNKQNLNLNKIIKVKDNDKFKVSDIEFTIVHTPGHTLGSICIYVDSENVLFTGDTIFCDSYGRCDLYSGDFDDLVQSIKKLFDKYNDIVIYPGHNKKVNIEKAKKYIKLLLALKGVQF